MAAIAPYEAAGVRRGRAAGERKDLGGPCRCPGLCASLERFLLLQ